VAYIDILGFAEYIKDNRETPDKPLELLQEFINKAKMFNTENKLKIMAFSDNIVISMLAKEPSPPFDYDSEYWDFLFYMNTMQSYMIMTLGILPIRGGITFGNLYHNKSEVLFGEALVDAYNLEHSHAFYPRIVVNPKFLEPYKYVTDHKNLASLGYAKMYSEFNAEKLKRQYPVAYDFDGVLYCNYLSILYFPVRHEWADISLAALDAHKLFVESRLSETSDLKILRKYTWMKSYHNWFCEPFEEFQKYIIQD